MWLRLLRHTLCHKLRHKSRRNTRHKPPSTAPCPAPACVSGAGRYPRAMTFPRLTALALCLAAAPLRAEPDLALPLDCTLGETCFLMNFMDRNPEAGAEDIACGPVTYDGHRGTDFALTSFAAMREGVEVLAAAPGVVRGTRDGMPDLGLDGTPAEVLEGRDCGNGVLIDHGDGWETQYCHLREGSLAVGEGDRVSAGDPLGLVGYSGRTEFPHVHIAVRKDGQEVDPFDTDGARVCGADDGPEDDLWKEPPGYQPGGVVAAGALDAVPDYDAVKDGSAHRETLPADAPALVGWVLMHGGRAGDLVEITLTDPAGAVFLRHEERLEKTQAMVMRAAGRRAPEDGFTPGNWRIEAVMTRDGTVLDRAGTVTRLSP